MSTTDSPGEIASPIPAAPGPQKVVDRRLVEGPVAMTLIRFSAPLLVTSMLVSLSGTWSAIWVSHLLGPDALTAVVNANLFMVMMTGIVLGAGSAAGIAVAQAIGADDLQAAKRVAANAIVFAIAASSLIAAGGIAFAPEILELIHMPKAAWDPAVVFFRITCLSLPSAFTLIFLIMLIRGTGDARTPFRFTIVAIVIGLVATPLFLTGFGGMPRLGIAGAGWSGVVANTGAVLALLVYAYRRRLPLALHRADLHMLLPDPRIMAMLVRRGTPLALETLIVQGAYFVLVSRVNAHGAAAAAAYSGAAQLWAYVQMPAGAVAASMSAMAAMNIGANRWDRIDRIAFRGCLVASGFTIAATLGVYALGDLPLKLFLPSGGEALEIARSINLVVLWGWIVLAVTLGLNAMVRANGAMLAPTIVFGVTMWVLRVPFATLLEPYMGIDAIWWSFPVGSLSSALLAYAYYRWGGWRRNALLVAKVRVEAPAPAPGMTRTG